MAKSGFGLGPLDTPEVARARRLSALERRERFEREHPEVRFSARREGARLVIEVSEPGRPTAAYDDASAMMDDLEARYTA